MGDTLLQPGQIIQPFVTEQHARLLIERLYGLEVVKIKQLKGYDDKNFYVEVSEVNKNLHKSNASGYVLKIMNSMESKNLYLVEAQNEVMLFLGKNGIVCPQPVLNLKQEYNSLEKINCEVSDKWTENNVGDHPSGLHLVRLMHFIPGQMLVDVPSSHDLFYKTGKYVGHLHKILKEFHHPALEGHITMWNLISVPKLDQFLFVVKDEKRKKIASEVLNCFSSEVVSVFNILQKGLIHGDLNEQNILVCPSATKDGQWDIYGLLDFGDCRYSSYLFDMAIAICYMMLQTTTDPLDTGGHVIAGYMTEDQLPEFEFNLLKICVAARYCQSLVLGEYSYLQDPGNEYLLTTAKRGWDQLIQLWDEPQEALYQRWKKIIANYKQ